MVPRVGECNISGGACSCHVLTLLLLPVYGWTVAEKGFFWWCLCSRQSMLTVFFQSMAGLFLKRAFSGGVYVHVNPCSLCSSGIYVQVYVSPNSILAPQEEVSHASKIASRYQDESTYSHPDADSQPVSAVSREKSASPIPPPPPINLALLTSSPLPSSAMIYAAAAAGGGLASDESLLCLPLHSSELHSIRPQLTFLVNLYGIQFVSCAFYFLSILVI